MNMSSVSVKPTEKPITSEAAKKIATVINQIPQKIATATNNATNQAPENTAKVTTKPRDLAVTINQAPSENFTGTPEAKPENN